MSNRFTKLLIVPTLLLVVAACQGSQGEPADEEPVRTTEVSVVDNDFEPAVIEISAGDTVTWTWEGSRPHDVEGDGFKSEVQESGTFEYTFDETGEYDYVCNIHSGMSGTVVVTEP